MLYRGIEFQPGIVNFINNKPHILVAIKGRRSDNNQEETREGVFLLDTGGSHVTVTEELVRGWGIWDIGFARFSGLGGNAVQDDFIINGYMIEFKGTDGTNFIGIPQCKYSKERNIIGSSTMRELRATLTVDYENQVAKFTKSIKL